jgi:hypothetical protein
LYVFWPFFGLPFLSPLWWFRPSIFYWIFVTSKLGKTTFYNNHSPWKEIYFEPPQIQVHLASMTKHTFIWIHPLLSRVFMFDKTFPTLIMNPFT